MPGLWDYLLPLRTLWDWNDYIHIIDDKSNQGFQLVNSPQFSEFPPARLIQPQLAWLSPTSFAPDDGAHGKLSNAIITRKLLHLFHLQLGTTRTQEEKQRELGRWEEHNASSPRGVAGSPSHLQSQSKCSYFFPYWMRSSQGLGRYHEVHLKDVETETQQTYIYVQLCN